METSTTGKSIELVDCTSIKSKIYSLHQQYHDNENNQQKLIEILGGIDQILSDYLKTTNNMLLTESQLQAIQSVIQQNQCNLKSKSEANSKSNHIVHTFNKSNTFIHAIFGIKNGNTICKIIYSKILWSLIFLLLVLGFVVNVAYPLDDLFIYIRIGGVIQLTLALILLIFILLSVNRKLFKSSIKHFVFWLKVYI